MILDKNVIQIVSLPFRFYKKENQLSIFNLVKGLELNQDLSIDDLETIKLALEKNPNYLQSWFDWSANKRANSGWYLIKEKNKAFIGFLDINKDFINNVEYENEFEACSAFIIKELNSIGNS